MTRSRLPRALAALLLLGACEHQFSDPSRRLGDPVDDNTVYPTVVHEPTAFGVLDQPLVVDAGEREIPAGTACSTCHGPIPDPRFSEDPDEDFHQGIVIEHGQLVCNQCHDTDRSQLRLADGSPVPFVEVMRLCAQCHGPQFRDYSHGAHGGMNGHWDLHQGPRIRNTCVDCHAPHSPSIKQVMPVAPPLDRRPGGHPEGGGHEASGEHPESSGSHDG